MVKHILHSSHCLEYLLSKSFLNNSLKKLLIFVTQTNTGPLVKRVPQEQMVGVKSYPFHQLDENVYSVVLSLHHHHSQGYTIDTSSQKK